MGEYIDRQAVLDELDEDIEEFVECDYALKTAKKYIKKIPPADVRPVVLCKDCDLWNEWDSSGRESLGTYRCSCAEWTTEITTYYTGPDEFCSRGVRRDLDG